MPQFLSMFGYFEFLRIESRQFLSMFGCFEFPRTESRSGLGLPVPGLPVRQKELFEVYYFQTDPCLSGSAAGFRQIVST